MDPMMLASLAGGLMGGGTEVTQSNTSTTNVGTSIQLSNMSSGGQGQSPSNSASGSSSATPSGEGGGGFPSVFPAGSTDDYGMVSATSGNPDAVGISPMSSIPAHIYALGAAALGGMVYLMTRKKKGRK